MVVDTHAHLTDESLAADIEYYLREAAEAGVLAILTVGTTLESSRAAVALAERFESVRAAVGWHPNHCCQAQDDDWHQIQLLCQHPRVAALGETGLDKYWDDCPWATQLNFFRRHLELSRSTRLPVVIHTRQCAEETLEILLDEAQRGPLQGVMHSFTGNSQVAHGCVELGLYIGFAGMLTYKNAADIREVAATLPSERILVETDCPYLTPHPFRGKRPNHPALVIHTLQCLADLRGVSCNEMAAQTTENAQRLFGPW